MKLIDRFKRLTIWNKLGVVSGLASIIGIPLAIFLYWLPQATNNNNLLSATRVATITGLKADLEKIKTLLPFDQALSDCLKKRREPFDAAVEACARERRLNGGDAQQIIERSRASLRLYFSQKELEVIDEHLKAVKLLAYEMWNNQLILEYWRKRGCPSNIAILAAEEGSKYLQRHKDQTRCAITVEKYKSYLDRDAKNNNLITATREATVSIDNLNFIVVPGHENTIENFFYIKNNNLYGKMLYQIEELTPLLWEWMDK